jgi:hypothetical protein
MSLPKEKFVPKPSKYDQLLKGLNELIIKWRAEAPWEIQWDVAACELESVINKVIK